MPCKDYGAHTAALFRSEVGPEDFFGLPDTSSPNQQISNPSRKMPADAWSMHAACMQHGPAGNLEGGGDGVVVHSLVAGPPVQIYWEEAGLTRTSLSHKKARCSSGCAELHL